MNYDGAIILTAAYALPDPTALIHIHSSIRQEYYPLFLKNSSSDLREASARDGAVLQHDALSGQALRAEAHGAADLPRRAGPAQHPGDLAVGHDLARRYLRHDVIDLLIKKVHMPVSKHTEFDPSKKPQSYERRRLLFDALKL